MTMSSGCMDQSFNCLSTEKQGAGAHDNQEELYCNDANFATASGSKLNFIVDFIRQAWKTCFTPCSRTTQFPFWSVFTPRKETRVFIARDGLWRKALTPCMPKLPLGDYFSVKAILEVEVQNMIKVSYASHVVEAHTFVDCAKAMMGVHLAF
ncbi:unnamed protein product [Closterium sp. Yama58-4]|nr:unnamed protein product [Closterium sp. Yama58-4]